MAETIEGTAGVGEGTAQITTQNQTPEDYINAINQLKQNTVSKEDYQKLKDENKKLLDTLVSGGQIEQPKEKKKIEDLRKELFGGGLNNLQYIQTALELDDAIIENGGESIFLPTGEKTLPTQEDYDAVERVKDVFKQCIEYSKGDSNLFTAELQRRTVDAAPLPKGRRAK